MFISVLDLFKIGIGPSSSHTMGPMLAASDFIQKVEHFLSASPELNNTRLICTFKGSLAHTGRGHASDSAVVLGCHGYRAKDAAKLDISELLTELLKKPYIILHNEHKIEFDAKNNIIFDTQNPATLHPNEMQFELRSENNQRLIEQTYFSIGGGFISTPEHIASVVAPLKMEQVNCPYPFDSASDMLQMSHKSGLSIAQMKRANELHYHPEKELNQGLDAIWQAMYTCIESGLNAEGILPGGLSLCRRAKDLYNNLQHTPEKATLNDWLCAYAMSVNEQNAAGQMVVTAPTNGAAGVIPAVLNYLVKHENISQNQIHDFLLTAAAIGGLIKHRSSISGAEVGCQGEVGSAASMAAAGLCAVHGGSTEQIENAAEIALEHHLGMTCDPVNGLVQVPCIERNGFGAIKAYTASSLALYGSGRHFISLDSCIQAMKQTGEEMSNKFKETSLGGLAVSITEC